MQPTIHDAIRSVYSNVVSVYGADVNTLIAQDANGDNVTIVFETVTAELTNLQNAYTISQVKEKASSLLSATDWATLSDVTSGSPKLNNQAEFITYRQEVRAIAVNPTANPNWPTKPTEQWVTA
jgi:hypothetical protein